VVLLQGHISEWCEKLGITPTFHFSSNGAEKYSEIGPPLVPPDKAAGKTSPARIFYQRLP